MRDLVRSMECQDVSDSLKMGVGSIPIRLAQQQVLARICDASIFNPNAWTTDSRT